MLQNRSFLDSIDAFRTSSQRPEPETECEKINKSREKKDEKVNMSKILYTEGDIEVQLEDKNNTNRGKFRRLAREVSGDVYEVPDDNLVIFAYSSKHRNRLVVGEISFSLADLKMREPGTNFDTEYYPQISFLFIHRDFQMKGLGKILVQECVKVAHEHQDLHKRSVRLQSAEDAVEFFKKCGFKTVGEPYECVHSGSRSRLFDTLVNMEEISSPH